MATGHLSGVIQQLRRAALSQDSSELSDGQLLDAFIADGDESAFEALLRRHGSMVLGVCRRVLRNESDAEDSFQATFLVFVRKAASIMPRQMVGNWLYGVAFRTALEAKKMNARRRAKEKEAASVPKSDVAADDVWMELLPLLDEELSRLPDKYRVPVVLCDLEGKTQKEAAEQLGWPEGTLSSRLFRARVLLAKGFARHGLVLSGGALAVLLSQNAVTAGVPASLLVTTMNGASLAATGKIVALGGISTKVMALTAGVQRAMWFGKVKQAMICLVLAMAMSATAIGLATYPSAAATENSAPKGDNTKPSDVRTVFEKNSPTKEPEKPDRMAGPLEGFTAVDFSSAFDANIVRGDLFRVEFAAEDSQAEAVKDGEALKISGGSGTKQKRTQVTIAMPTLRAVTLDGASVVTLHGFDSDDDFRAKVGKDCVLQGTIKAGSIEIDMSGSGRSMLKGSASKGTFSSNGSGQFLLAEFSLESASVRLNGKSTAKVNVHTRLDYDLKGVSRLSYRGNPSLGKREKIGTAFVGRE